MNNGSFVFVFFKVNGNVALDALLKRYQRLGSRYARNLLQLSVDQVHQLLIVAGIELDKHGVGACGEMTLDNLGNVRQELHHIAIHGAALQRNAHIGAGVIAQRLGIDVEPAARDDSCIDEALHALMDGGARNVALGCHILERYAGIARQDAQYFLVQIGYSFHRLFVVRHKLAANVVIFAGTAKSMRKVLVLFNVIFTKCKINAKLVG